MEQIKDWIVSAPENFKNFIIENNTNPVLWVALFFIGILVFYLTFNALNKNK
jgi:hypothetical protein